ncbi:MAG: PAS domain S-box protein [Syntrophobacteraceae bacterium]
MTMGVDRKRRSIRSVLILVLIAALLPVLLVQAFLLVGRFSAVQAREAKANGDVARAVGGLFRAGIESVAKTTLMLGEMILRFPPDEPQAVVDLLSSALTKHPEAIEFSWLGPEGRVIASSDPGRVGADRGSEEYLSALGPDRPWTLGSLERDRQEGAAFVVARRIESESGTVLGILAVTLDAERFADCHLDFRRAPVADFMIFDRKGFAAFRRPYVPFDDWQQRDFSKEEYVSRALGGQEAGGRIHEAATDEDWFVLRAPIPELGWVAGAGRECGTATAPLWRNIAIGVGLSLLCLFLSGGIALHYGKVLMRDLNRLRDTIREWRLTDSLGEDPSDLNLVELQRVLGAFKGMASQRARAEQALRESEEQFRGTFENVAVGIAHVGLDGRFLLVNERMCRITGYPVAELLKKTFQEITHPEDLDEDVSLAAKLLSGDIDRYALEKRYIRKDGATVWINLTGSLQRDWNGQPRYFIGTVEDISDRKQIEEELHRNSIQLKESNDKLGQEIDHRRRTEAALRESQERLRAQYLALPVPTTTWQRVGEHFIMTDYNIASHDLSKGGVVELIGLTEDVLFKDRPDLKADFLRCFAEKRVITKETPYRLLCTGEDKYIRFSFAYVPPDLVLVHTEDRTENRLVEEHLTAEREKFNQLADNIGLIFWISPVHSEEVLYINRAYETVFGRSLESLEREPRSWKEAFHDEDYERVKDLIQRAPSGPPDVTELRIMRPNGSLRWLRVRTFPIRDERGETYRIAGIAEDITEERQLRQEIDQRLQQVIQADKLASLGELVAGIAHEINNPNSFITYNIPLLEDTWELFEPIVREFSDAHPDWRKGRLTLPKLSEDMLGIIGAIKEGSERINRVVANLKDFARLDESSQKTPLQINEVIEKTLTIVGAQLRKSFLQIDLALSPDLPDIPGHFQKLEQVVANLLLNATHAAGGRTKGKVSIRTRSIARLRCVLIEVEDNGSGMDREVLGHIFEPFFTTRRTSGGTGLGLSVSYGLVQEHRGRIAVLSRPGLGSRFTIFLPVDEEVDLDLSPTIVAVDDDPGTLGMLRSRFTKIKEQAEAFEDPSVVLGYLESHPEADVVITDLRMPEITGWELLKRIKERFPLIPVILYSGDPNLISQKPEDVPEPDVLLAKPFRFAELTHAINAVGRQRL